jgi:hypothetical protein
MAMRKAFWLSMTAAALVVTGVAVAHGGGTRSATPVAGTFTATQVTNAKTSTCTNADGTWTHLDATYSGTAAGDADLAGAARLKVHAVINTSRDIGTVSGSLRIDTAGADTTARFDSVYAGGKLAGLASGRAHDPSARLLANISASFSATGGFTNGRLGGGTEGGTAVELVSGACAKPPVQKAVLRVKGTIVSASSTSLVVRSGSDQITCAVDSKLAGKVAGLQAGREVTATCRLADGTYRLTSVSGGHGEKEHHSRHP